MTACVKKATSIALIVMMCTCLCGCPITEKAEILKTINEFESACNDMDIEGMLDCFDPTIVSFLRLLPIPTDGEELNELLITIIDFIYVLDVDSAGAIVEFFESVRIRPKSIDIRSKRAVVEARLSYRIGGKKMNDDITLILVDRGNEWYLTII